jgi:hypothetical protein
LAHPHLDQLLQQHIHSLEDCCILAMQKLTLFFFRRIPLILMINKPLELCFIASLERLNVFLTVYYLWFLAHVQGKGSWNWKVDLGRVNHRHGSVYTISFWKASA